MEKVMELFNWALSDGMHMLVSLEGMLMAMIGFALLVPGKQPEAFLQSLVNLISKISKKK